MLTEWTAGLEEALWLDESIREQLSATDIPCQMGNLRPIEDGGTEGGPRTSLQQLEYPDPGEKEIQD